jgi:type IV pilus assembly protein PilP
MKKNIFFIVIVCMFSAGVSAADQPGEYTFMNNKTTIKNPYELRDPFKKIVLKKKGLAKMRERSSGVFDNSTENLETKHTDNLRVLGVMIGKNRRALVKAPGNSDPFVIQEGMTIGSTGAEVKAILPGGVVLVEKIKNVYDQEEYLETILPVTGN